MSSRELVLRAIHFQGPSRLPLVFRSSPERSDILTVGYAPPDGWQPHQEGEDEWGCRWANIIGTGLGQVVAEPLAAAPTLDPYAFPDPHAPGRYAGLASALARYPDRYLAGSLGLSGFSRMMALRGFENLLCDLLLERTFATELADEVFRFEAGVIAEYARRGVHGVWLFDDLGTERGLMMRPDTWREVFKPRYAAQARLVHGQGMQILLHSCGDIWEIIPDLIEIGFDVLNLEQPLLFGTPEQNGIDRLAEHFGGRVCFCTNVDSQRTLIMGTREEVVQEVQHIIRALARPAGGLIPLADCGRDQHTTLSENIAVMVEAFEVHARGKAR